MANVFTLWGELKADTRNFEQALIRADKEIQQTEKNLSRLEAQTKKFGNTSAVTARQQEKIGEQLASAKKRINDATQAFDQGIIGHRRMATVLNQTDSRMMQLNSRIKDSSARIKDWSAAQTASFAGLGGLGGAMGALGLSFTGMAYSAGQAAITVDNWKNVLKAATGSTEAAKIKLAELNEVARTSPGVLTSFAVSTYALLKPMKVTEESLNALIQAFGRIKLSNPSADLNKFAFNLNQLSVAFDLRDVKEAIENFPRFGEILKQAFNLKAEADNVKDLTEELKKLKAEGKITKESFMSGIANAINKDVNLGKLEDTLGTRLEKALERVKIRLAPLGASFLDPFLDEMEKTSPDMKSLDNLSKILFQVVNANTQHLQKLAEAFLALGPKVSDALETVSATCQAWGRAIGGSLYTIGVALVQGFINGIRARLSEARSAATELGSIAEAAARARLDTRSPSKVFFAIGKDTAQGFIDGIESLKTGVHAKMADLVDIRKILGLKKKDAAGVELLTSLIRELDELTPRTRLQAVLAELTAGKYAGLNAQLREHILLLAQTLTGIEAKKKATEAYLDILEEFRRAHPIEMGEDMQGSGRDFTGGTGLTEAIGSIEDYTRSLENLMYIQDLAIGEPPRVQPWNDFWNMMGSELRKFKESLPSLKQALGENLINAIVGIGDVFANALNDWISGTKSFFESFADGFRQLISEIIAQLIRLMVYKLILKLLGGTKLGKFLNIGQSGGGEDEDDEFASGGFTGHGSPSAVAGIVHKGEFVMPYKAVKHWGRGVLERMKNMQPMAPQMAFAGAGGGSSVVTNSSSFSPTFNINISGASSPQATAAMVKGEVIKALRQHEMRNK